MQKQVYSRVAGLGIASLLICGTPCAVLAQQGANSAAPVLPGPSLDDSAAPVPKPAPAPLTVPSPASNPPAGAAATQNGGGAASTASPSPQESPTRTAPSAAAAPPPSQPAAPVVEESNTEEPWYRRMWGSVTGWFSGMGSRLSQPRATAPAPAPAQAPAQPSANGSRGREGFASDTPERSIRTGMGDCLKTGTWTPQLGSAECPNGAASADAKAMTSAGEKVSAAQPSQVAPPTPPKPSAAPANPSAEPVEVKPLSEAPMKDE